MKTNTTVATEAWSARLPQVNRADSRIHGPFSLEQLRGESKTINTGVGFETFDHEYHKVGILPTLIIKIVTHSRPVYNKETGFWSGKGL